METGFDAFVIMRDHGGRLTDSASPAVYGIAVYTNHSIPNASAGNL